MTRRILSVTVLFLFATLVQAQPPGGPGGPGGPAGFSPPGFHLMTALDANKDGKISTDEIRNAVAALQRLDKDKDGKLSSEEIGWPPTPGNGFPGPGGGRPEFGRGVPPGMGGFPRFGRGGFPGFGGQDGGRPRRPDPDKAAQRKAGGGRFFSVEQLQPLDRDGDGKIKKDEIPAGLQDLILGRVDSNGDGVIDKDELANLAKQKEKK